MMENGNKTKKRNRGKEPEPKTTSTTETTLSTPTHLPLSERFAIIQEWLKNNGVVWGEDLIKLTCDDEKGIHIIAVKDLSLMGEVVCTIPKKVILSKKNCGISDIIEEENLGGGLALTLCVMFEMQKGVDSVWYGYLRSLPEFEPLPMFWALEELEYLKGTELSIGSSPITQDKEYMKSDYETLVLPILKSHPSIITQKDHTSSSSSSPKKIRPSDSPYFCFERFCQVSSLVSSRAFRVDDFHEDCMVPFADLFNHLSGAENVHMEGDDDVCGLCGCTIGECDHQIEEDDEDESEASAKKEGGKDGKENAKKSEEEEKERRELLDMVIVKTAKEGEEVFNTYGELGNATLLTKYGFTHPHNPFDTINIDVELIENVCEKIIGPKAKEKIRFCLQFKKIFGGEDGYYEFGRDGFAEDFMLYLIFAVVVVDNEEFKKWRKGKKAIAKQIISSFLSSINTEKIMEHSVVSEVIVKSARERFRLYRSSLEEDRTELEGLVSITKSSDTASTKRRYFSCLLRIGEKEIIEKIIQNYTEVG